MLELRFLGTTTIVAHVGAWKNYWVKPEETVPHRVSQAEPIISPELLDATFPDFNCDRAEGGRWRTLRHGLEMLLSLGFGQASTAAISQWRSASETLERVHGHSGWLHPAAGESWVFGQGVREAVRNTSVRFVCPLGVASVLIVSLLVFLAEAQAEAASGNMVSFFEQHVEEYEMVVGALQAVLQRVIRKPRLALSILVASHWPVLDLLAVAERLVLHDVRQAAASTLRFGNCPALLTPTGQNLAALARRLAAKAAEWHPGSNGNIAYRRLEESDEVARAATSLLQEELVSGVPDCVPLVLASAMASGLVCVEHQTFLPEKPDPESCLRTADSGVRRIIEKGSLAGTLLRMDFTEVPVFGVWLNFRAFAMHRGELPFSSEYELAAAFDLPFRSWAESGNLGAKFPSLFRDALEALQNEALAEAIRTPPVAILTACWGRVHSARLSGWLEAVQRAGMGQRTAVLCHDLVSLTTCRAVHVRPLLCLDARQWPRTLLSKLAAIALFVRWHIDVLWLDSDAVLLQDPVQFLKPLRSGGDMHRESAQMLFSVEPVSWNCVNAGVFFLRGSRDTQRYLGYWISLYLERPFNIDQSVLFFLLGLMPNMSYEMFSSREELLNSKGSRTRVLGTLRTPAWGALDGRAPFTMTGKVVTGGFDADRESQVVVLHLLESWPKDRTPVTVYDDIPDLVETILEGLSGRGRGEAFAWELVRRSAVERGPEFARRDCKLTYVHGR